MAIQWHRDTPGYYTATYNARKLEVERAGRAIEGGCGWVVWVDGRGGDSEWPTLAKAKDVARRTALA